jgi:hypothetical protein
MQRKYFNIIFITAFSVFFKQPKGWQPSQRR